MTHLKRICEWLHGEHWEQYILYAFHFMLVLQPLSVIESRARCCFCLFRKSWMISLMRISIVSSWTLVNFSSPLQHFATNSTDLLAGAWRVTHVLKVASPRCLSCCIMFVLQGAMKNYTLLFVSLASGIVPWNGDLCS